MLFPNFRNIIGKKNEKYLEAPVFNNTMFLCERPRPRVPVPGCINSRVIRRGTRDAYSSELLQIKMKTLLNDGQLIDYNSFCRGTGVPFSANEYLSLLSAATYARERYGNKERSNGKNVCFTDSIFIPKS